MADDRSQRGSCFRSGNFAARSALASWLALVGWSMVAPTAGAADDAAAVEARLAASVEFLADDAQEGRGLGTAGLDRAADYLAEQFRQLGLRTDLVNGGPFQEFTVTIGAELGEPNQVKLTGPPAADGTSGPVLDLVAGQDFTPLSLGGSATLDLPVVFVGYGITAPDLNYDDYAGLDVSGKAVIVLRHEPQQDNPHSGFDGTQASEHAPFTRKVANAAEHGARAVIFLTDEYEIRERVTRRYKRWQTALEALTSAEADAPDEAPPTLAEIRAQYAELDELLDKAQSEADKLAEEFDPLLKFATAADDATPRDFPVLHVTRAALDPLVQAATGQDLAAWERAIDEGPAPQSRELAGWRLTGQITVNRQTAVVKNVLAVLDGSGPLAEETLVIGAHYDHLGRGGSGSLAPESSEIHNGADDNASGTATLLEVARQLRASGPWPRRVVFIAFTAEERGLLGSARYVREPAVPLEQTIGMLNMDMVGRLDDDKLIIHGTGTAPEFDEVLNRLNERYAFKISRQPGGFGPSDHSSFYAKEIPVLHFFTGTHADYHRPSDDLDKLNLPGMRRVGELVAETARELLTADERPTYVATRRPAMGGGDATRPYFGSVPDFSQERPGYALMSVTKEGPAEKAGLRGGDVIVKLAESQIGSLEDFDSALRKHKAGDKVKVTVVRDGAEVELEVTLEAPR